MSHHSSLRSIPTSRSHSISSTFTNLTSTSSSSFGSCPFSSSSSIPEKRKEERININCISLRRDGSLLSIYKPGTQTGINKRCGFDESSASIRYVRSMTDIIEYPYRATKELACKMMGLSDDITPADTIQKMYPHINNYFQYCCIAGEVYFITLNAPLRKPKKQQPNREFIIIVSPWKSYGTNETIYTIGELIKPVRKNNNNNTLTPFYGTQSSGLVSGAGNGLKHKNDGTPPFKYIGHFAASELCSFLSNEVRRDYPSYIDEYDLEWWPKVLVNLPDVVDPKVKQFDSSIEFDNNSLQNVLRPLDKIKNNSNNKKKNGNDAHKMQYFDQMRNDLGLNLYEMKEEIKYVTKQSINCVKLLGNDMVVCQIYFHKCYFHSEFVLPVELVNHLSGECHKFGIVFVEERGKYVFKQLLTPYMIYYNIGLNYPNSMGLNQPATLQWWPAHVFSKYYSFLTLFCQIQCNVTDGSTAESSPIPQAPVSCSEVSSLSMDPVSSMPDVTDTDVSTQEETETETETESQDMVSNNPFDLSEDIISTLNININRKEETPNSVADVKDVLAKQGKTGRLQDLRRIGTTRKKSVGVPVVEMKHIGNVLPSPWSQSVSKQKSKFDAVKALQNPNILVSPDFGATSNIKKVSKQLQQPKQLSNNFSNLNKLLNNFAHKGQTLPTTKDLSTLSNNTITSNTTVTSPLPEQTVSTTPINKADTTSSEQQQGSSSTLTPVSNTTAPKVNRARNKVNRAKNKNKKTNTRKVSKTSSSNGGGVVAQKKDNAEIKFFTWWDAMIAIQAQDIAISTKLLQTAIKTSQFCELSRNISAKVDDYCNISCEKPHFGSEFSVQYRIERFWELLDYFAGAYGQKLKISAWKSKSKFKLDRFDSINLWLNYEVSVFISDERVEQVKKLSSVGADVADFTDFDLSKNKSVSWA